VYILDDLTDAERDRIKLVIVLGAPKNSPDLYKGPWELVYHSDPGHMSGPRALLGELIAQALRLLRVLVTVGVGGP
jgi:hypothetical protein